MAKGAARGEPKHPQPLLTLEAENAPAQHNEGAGGYSNGRAADSDSEEDDGLHMPQANGARGTAARSRAQNGLTQEPSHEDGEKSGEKSDDKSDEDDEDAKLRMRHGWDAQL